MAKSIRPILLFLLAFTVLLLTTVDRSDAIFRECSTAYAGPRSSLKCVRDCERCVKRACASQCSANLSEPKCVECYGKGHDCAA